MKKYIILLAMALTTMAFAVDFKVPERGGVGTVIVETKPPGSKVYLDGEEIGKTPLKTQFKSGRWDLLVIDQEHELAKTRFNVFADKENIFETDTKMPYGNIKVTTIPDKCDIYVDGELADGTDGSYLMIKGLDAGDILVRAECGRYKKDTLVVVPPEGTVEILINAKKK